MLGHKYDTTDLRSMKSEYDYASKKKFVDVLNASRHNSPLPSPFTKERMSKTL